MLIAGRISFLVVLNDFLLLPLVPGFAAELTDVADADESMEWQKLLWQVCNEKESSRLLDPI